MAPGTQSDSGEVQSGHTAGHAAPLSLNLFTARVTMLVVSVFVWNVNLARRSVLSVLLKECEQSSHFRHTIISDRWDYTRTYTRESRGKREWKVPVYSLVYWHHTFVALESESLVLRICRYCDWIGASWQMTVYSVLKYAIVSVKLDQGEIHLKGKWRDLGPHE